MSSYDWEDLGIAIIVAIFALVLAFLKQFSEFGYGEKLW